MVNRHAAILLLIAALPCFAAQEFSIQESHMATAALVPSTAASSPSGGEKSIDSTMEALQRIRIEATLVLAEGKVLACNTAEIGGSAFVQLSLTTEDAEAMRLKFDQWQAKFDMTRRLIFVKDKKVVHSHDPSLAGVADQKLYLHMGARDKAQEAKRALCGGS